MPTPQALCPACKVYKSVDEHGRMKLHTRHGITCAGSGQLSPPKKARVGSAWAAARKATLERDGQRCRKCFSSTGLEAHHVIERCHGGRDELENLVALCSLCHDEWHHGGEDLGVGLLRWIGVPPARVLVLAWLLPVNSGETVENFKRYVVETMRAVREAHG